MKESLQMTQSNEPDVENRLVETSFIFHPITLVILGVCLLVTVWFKMFILIAVFVFLFILSLFIFIWKRNSLKNINLSTQLSPTRLFTGDYFSIQATIKNNKWLPLVWLDLELKPSKLVGWGEQLKMKKIIRLLWLLSYQEVTCHFKGKALHRGVYLLNDVIIRSGDGFRFSEIAKMFDQQQKTYIYPQLVAVRIPTFSLSMKWGAEGTKGGLLEDPLIVSGVRDYEPGDDWKQYNWWASARSGKMQVNVNQPIVLKQLLIYLDIEGFAVENLYPEDEEKQHAYKQKQEVSFERFLSVVASFIVACHNQGFRIAYGSNGLNYREEKQTFLVPEKEVERVLDQLAELTDKTADKNTENDFHGFLTNHRMPTYIFAKYIRNRHYLWYEQNRNNDIQIYYLEDNKLSEKPHYQAKSMDGLLLNEGLDS